MTADQVIAALHQSANPQAVAGMVRFGSKPAQAVGISIPVVRKMAKALGKNHSLALELWASGIHEARILASMIADPRLVSEHQMEAWVKDFDSWGMSVTRCVAICLIKHHMPFKKQSNGVIVNLNSCGVRVL